MKRVYIAVDLDDNEVLNESIKAAIQGHVKQTVKETLRETEQAEIQKIVDQRIDKWNAYDSKTGTSRITRIVQNHMDDKLKEQLDALDIKNSTLRDRADEILKEAEAYMDRCIRRRLDNISLEDYIQSCVAEQVAKLYPPKILEILIEALSKQQ